MKSEQGYFEKDIRKMFIYYAIIPVLLLTFISLLVFWLSWSYIVKNSNQKENLAMTKMMEDTINSYEEIANEVAEIALMREDKVDAKDRVRIFEQVYKVSNRVNKKAELYIVNEEFRPVVGSTEELPYYLGESYHDWGIMRILQKDPNNLAFSMNLSSDNKSMELVVGKVVRDTRQPGDDGFNKVLGYVFFIFDSRQFELNTAELESQIVITNEYQLVFFSNHFSLLNPLGRFEIQDLKINQSFRNDKGSFYITESELFEGKLQIYSISTLNRRSSVFFMILVVVLLIFAMMIIAVFHSSKLVAARKTKNLYLILGAFEKVKSGNLNEVIDLEGNDEWSVIAQSYNVMLESLKQQIERNKEMGKLVVSSQEKQLESQFNPHFLFNSLENIRFMCKLDPEAANQMVLNLSGILRYSINNASEEVFIKDDIHYIENYMSILKYRFGQRFEYRIEVPQIAESCIIPRLIVQPMIENAIKYGFEGKERIEIIVRVELAKEFLIMSCEDNGLGMAEERMREIQEILTKSTNTSNHFGLYNIHRRIQLKYGNDYGINIYSRMYEGTLVKAILPIIREKEE